MPFRVRENSTSCPCKHETVVPKPEGRQTRRAEARWKRLGADPEDFNAFTDLFARRRSPFIRQASGAGWQSVPHMLTDDLIVQHLLADEIPGKPPIWIGTRSFETTKFAAVDIDSRGDAADFVRRCDLCESVLYALGIPRRAWLVRNSPSGGRHYYIFFRQPVYVSQLPELFRIAGLKLQAGKFEVYPSESQGFRLPFGHDPSGKSSLTWQEFIRRYRSGKIRRVCWATMWRRAYNLAQRPRVPAVDCAEHSHSSSVRGQTILGVPRRLRTSDHQAVPTARGEFLSSRPNIPNSGHRSRAPDISAIWSAGITEVGTRVSITKRLAWHLVFAKRMPESEVLALLLPWIYKTGKGTSKTVSADLEKGTRHAEQQTREIVRWFVQRRIENPQATGLRFTQTEIETFVRATEVLPPSEKSRHFRFALDFCAFAKSTGKLDDQGWVCLPSVEGIIKKWDDCSSGNSYKPRLDWAIVSGLAVLVREKAQSHRRPRTFAFAAIPARPGERCFSFNEALEHGLQLIASGTAPQASPAPQCLDEYKEFVSPGGRAKALQAKATERRMENRRDTEANHFDLAVSSDPTVVESSGSTILKPQPSHSSPHETVPSATPNENTFGHEGPLVARSNASARAGLSSGLAEATLPDRLLGAKGQSRTSPQGAIVDPYTVIPTTSAQSPLRRSGLRSRPEVKAAVSPAGPRPFGPTRARDRRRNARLAALGLPTHAHRRPPPA
jgi:hypothetical protein